VCISWNNKKCFRDSFPLSAYQ